MSSRCASWGMPWRCWRMRMGSWLSDSNAGLGPKRLEGKVVLVELLCRPSTLELLWLAGVAQVTHAKSGELLLMLLLLLLLLLLWIQLLLLLLKARLNLLLLLLRCQRLKVGEVKVF